MKGFTSSHENVASEKIRPSAPHQDHDFYRSACYTIVVRGQLDEGWSDYLGGLRLDHDDNGNTVLSGSIQDQPALHGMLMRIRDLGLTLISLAVEEPEGQY